MSYMKNYVITKMDNVNTEIEIKKKIKRKC